MTALQTDAQQIAARYKAAKAAEDVATAELRAFIAEHVPLTYSAIEMAEMCGITRGAVYQHLREAARHDQRNATARELRHAAHELVGA